MSVVGCVTEKAMVAVTRVSPHVYSHAWMELSVYLATTYYLPFRTFRHGDAGSFKVIHKLT